MPDPTGAPEGAIWPMPKFNFSVKWGGSQTFAFQEVIGLDTESQTIEYRAGNSRAYSTLKMPGIQKFGNVILKKGIVAKENSFFDWYSTVKMNTITRATVTISLLDETGSPVIIWTLTNAFVTKITGTDLKSDADEVAVQSMEIAYENLTIINS